VGDDEGDFLSKKKVPHTPKRNQVPKTVVFGERKEISLLQRRKNRGTMKKTKSRKGTLYEKQQDRYSSQPF
jgi:hypothetical protein